MNAPVLILCIVALALLVAVVALFTGPLHSIERTLAVLGVMAGLGLLCGGGLWGLVELLTLWSTR